MSQEAFDWVLSEVETKSARRHFHYDKMNLSTGRSFKFAQPIALQVYNSNLGTMFS
jgi:hypothetical protein